MCGYEVTAQFYDPLAGIAHAETDRRIAAALAPLKGTAGPVVDIGAGTGLSTALIATELPECEILAVEPDPVMRAALMTRVCALLLRHRVTILPFDLFAAPLPDTIAGAVLSASLVHFGPLDRARLWRLLAQRLQPGGLIIVEAQCPEAVDVEETEMATATVGRITYRGSARAKRIGADRQRWHMTYRTSFENTEISCDTASYECWTVSPERILEETTAAGFSGRVADDLVILHC